MKKRSSPRSPAINKSLSIGNINQQKSINIRSENIENEPT